MALLKAGFYGGIGFAVEFLVVGGGGAGGKQVGGGGGGGGVLSGVARVRKALPVQITVGGGSVNHGDTISRDGKPSRFGVALAAGGGGGGNGYISSSQLPEPGRNGGSGGGGGGFWFVSSSTEISGGSGTDGQGNSGGSSEPPNHRQGGGGGGASEPGSNATGKGGNGIVSAITGASVYYGGGGGGGAYPIVSGTSWGRGGLGDGASIAFSDGNPAENGKGGGGAAGNAGGNGGRGGSGVVIVAFPQTAFMNQSSITVSGFTLGDNYFVDASSRFGYLIYKFTTGGANGIYTTNSVSGTITFN